MPGSATTRWLLPALLALTPALSTSALAGWGAVPVSFEPNRGQTDRRVDFIARSRDGTGFLAGGALTLRFHRCAAAAARHSPPRDCRGYAVRMGLDGATRRSGQGLEPLPGVASYLVGSDPSRWVTGLPTYGQVLYRDVLPGVDLRYHGAERHLELDLLLAPSADPGRLRLTFDGADAVAVGADGDLRVSVADQTLLLRRPRAYQEIDGARREVAAAYVVRGKRRVAIALGARDRSRPVVVDPVIVYAAQLGSTVNDGLEAVAVNSAGEVYAAGFSDGTGFPITGGGLPLGGTDAVVVKLNVSGSALVYSTYFGGSGTDVAYGIAVDGSGNAAITGDTDSTNLPVPAAFQAALGGATDGFIAKLSSTGTGLVYSTYVGGSDVDHADAIAMDNMGAVYVAGGTFSASWPATPTSVEPGPSGMEDGYALKLGASGGNPAYATFLGGSLADYAQGIAVDGAGNALVVGGTASVNFIGANTGIQPQIAGATDAFVTKLSANGQAILFSTFFGGQQDDQATAAALDPATGGVIFAGQTTSTTTFPRSSGAYQTSNAGFVDAFVGELGPSGLLVFSTYLGGASDDMAWAVAKGATGVWVAGRTASTNFPTFSSPFQGGNAGGGDAFLTQVRGDGAALLYSTYLGGSGNDRAVGLAVDGMGSVYVVGESGAGFPVQPGSYANSPRGAIDAFAAKFRDPINVTSVTPASGPVAGGTAVQVAGSGFTSTLTVSFGGVMVSSVGLSQGVLSATTPAHAAGPVDVYVVASDGLKSNTLVNGYTYVGVDAGVPDAGPPDGGMPRPDGGTDGGTGDAGTDAGARDGGADGGEDAGGGGDAGLQPEQVDWLGCSCASGGAGPAAFALAALGMLAARARARRAQSRKPSSAPPSQ